MSVDGMALLYGIGTLLHHSHYNFTVEYICYISQFIKAAMDREDLKISRMINLLQCFIEDICLIRGINLDSLRLFYPDYTRYSMNRDTMNTK